MYKGSESSHRTPRPSTDRYSNWSDLYPELAFLLAYMMVFFSGYLAGHLSGEKSTSTTSEATRWEYMTVQYAQHDWDADGIWETTILPSHPEFYHLFFVCGGDIMANADCYERNSITQTDMLAQVGAAGWELVQFENNSSGGAYNATFFFKRPKP